MTLERILAVLLLLTSTASSDDLHELLGKLGKVLDGKPRDRLIAEHALAMAEESMKSFHASLSAQNKLKTAKAGIESLNVFLDQILSDTDKLKDKAKSEGDAALERIESVLKSGEL